MEHTSPQHGYMASLEGNILRALIHYFTRLAVHANSARRSRYLSLTGGMAGTNTKNWSSEPIKPSPLLQNCQELRSALQHLHWDLTVGRLCAISPFGETRRTVISVPQRRYFGVEPCVYLYFSQRTLVNQEPALNVATRRRT